MQEAAELSDSRHGAQGRRGNSREAFAVQVLLPKSPTEAERGHCPPRSGAAGPKPSQHRGGLSGAFSIDCPVMEGRLCAAVRLLYSVLCPDPRSPRGSHGGKGHDYFLSSRRGELGCRSGGGVVTEVSPRKPRARSGAEHRAEQRPLSKAAFTSRSKLFF